MSFKKIIWATDGSEAADTALTYVKSLASQEGASLTVVYSDENVVGPGAGFPAQIDPSELKEKIEQQAASLAEEGIDSDFKVISGPSIKGAAQMITEAARDEGADLIVVATRGHTALSGLLLGSVTHRLLQLAPCPVLAVPVS